MTPAANAQITQVDNTTSTPIPGAGHDYIHLLSETVNPANGAVSLRIQLPTVKGRGISLPFSIAYDSNTALHVIGGDYPRFGTATWGDNAGYLAQGGWSYSLPRVTSDGWDVTAGNYPNYYTCGTSSNYVFFDPNGGQHSLGIGTQVSANGPCPDAGKVSLGGGDAQVVAKLTNNLQVSTADGTVFYGGSQSNTIEDRNGNILKVQVNGSGGNFVVTDTAGRTAISSSGFGPTGTTNTVSVAGMNYQITWKQSTKNFPTQSQWAGPSGFPNQYDNCSPIASGSGSQTVASSITLPNGKQYKFYYGTDNSDPTYNNPYGLLSEIDYPDGGWVKYTWKLSDTLNELADYPGVIPWSGPDCSSDPQVVCYRPVQDGCAYLYKTPVVATRQVGFGGSSTPSLTQTFTTYSTTWTGVGTLPTVWTQKSTDLTTTDNVLNQSFRTAYTYQSAGVANNNVFANTTNSPQIPVEKTIQYYDSNSSLLRTVNKTWANLYDLASEQTILDNGLSSKTVYSYTSTFPAQLKEKDEYDFGATTPSRKTVNTYQAFSGTPGVITDEPCQTIVYDASGTRVAETDYFYDGGTTLCGSTPAPSVTDVSSLVAGTHDETNFAAASTVPRGNLTKKTQWLNTGTGPSTTYAYDKTGQVLSATDPCGNGTCSDIAGASHTTTYSYTDSYSSGTPAGNTNTYLTKITDALGNFTSFKYALGDGQLTSSTDPNLRVTTYKYNTPPTGCSFTDGLDRLSEIDNPDGGKTTYCYNDATYNASTPSPAVTTTKTITSSMNLVSVSASDGIGHPVKSILSSDPEGADTTDTAFDGSGGVLTQTNPHRAASATTDGTTTHAYDALGRGTSILQADGSKVTVSYAGNCTTVTDEAGISRQSCSDGLGRLISVAEQGTLGARGSATVTITGSDRHITTGNIAPGRIAPGVVPDSCYPNCPLITYDSGTLTITVNGYPATASYGQSSTPVSLASELAVGLNNNSSPVAATVSASTITITAKTGGTASNYSLSTSSLTDDPSDFGTGTTSFPFSPTPPPALTGGTNSTFTPLNTLYAYDILNNLACAVQKATDTAAFTTCAAAPATWRPRSFVYDSLSRLTSATNPESGTITYAYDFNGNLATKTAPKPNQTGSATVITSFTYDADNRLTKKTYNDGATPTVQYGYDGVALTGCTTTPPTLTDTNPKGRRTSMCDASGGTTWTLDITANTGWKSTQAQAMNAVTKTTVSQSNLGGMLAQLTYPSGRAVTYTSGAAGRALSAADTANSINYAGNAKYAPFGGLTSLTNGSSPITTTNSYNERLQPTILSAFITANTILSFSYDFHRANGDNGNVFQVVNNVDNNRTKNYTYDALNRIASAYTQGNSPLTRSWGETFTIDAWGNLTNRAAITGKTNYEPLSVTALSSNRLSGFGYDAAGNMTSNGSATYTYDAENRLTATAGVTYTYDGDGNRVKKSNGTLYWGAGPLAESGLTATATSWKEYVFFNGKRAARRDASNSSVHYYFADHLGSTSIITNSMGTTLEEDLDYYPYGGVAGGTASDHYLFTGKERDSESGLDDFGARYDASSLGRFMSPDVGRPELGDPQTWNRYAYVTNNPLFYIDPNGLERIGSYYVTRYAQVSETGGLWTLFLGLFGGHEMAEHDDSVFTPRWPNQPAPKGPWKTGEPHIHSAEGLQLEGAWYKKTDVQIWAINVDFKDGKAIITYKGTHEGVIFSTGADTFGEKDAVEIEDPTIDPAALQSLSDRELFSLIQESGHKRYDPVNRAINEAALQEQQRRQEEERKREEKKQKERCRAEQPGNPSCK